MCMSIGVYMRTYMCSMCIYARLYMCVRTHMCMVRIPVRAPVQWGTSGPMASAGSVQAAVPGGAGQAQCPLPRVWVPAALVSPAWFGEQLWAGLGLGKQGSGRVLAGRWQGAACNGASFLGALGSRCGSVSAEVGQQARNHAGG